MRILLVLWVTAMLQPKPGYDLKAEAPARGKVGSPAAARIVLRGKQGWHVNQDFPFELSAVAPAGVDLAKAKFGKADAKKFTEAEAVVEVGFTPRTAGQKQFEATVRFAVCTDSDCVPRREKLGWTVKVE